MGHPQPIQIMINKKFPKLPVIYCNYRNLSSSGGDSTNVNLSDSGNLLADTLRQFMFDLEVDDGLQAVGYTTDDIPALVKGTLPQVRHP